MNNKSTSAELAYPASGELPLRMTNDVLFHHLLQDTDHTSILKSIISSFFDIPIEEIKSATVENPISLGDDISSKEMILDVKTLLNDDKFINLEMQVINYHDWTDRSLSYLCRCFDNLKIGEDYSNVKAAHHIGFLDFKLFDDITQFFSNYKLREDVTSHLFSSKFSISVVDLTEISIATEEDKSRHRDLWASFFKAKTWEEINMLAQKDSVINEAAAKMYQLTEDQRIREQCFAREDYIRRERDRDHYFTTEIQKRDDIITQNEATIADMGSTIADKDATIADMGSTITALKAQLAKYQSAD